MVGLSRLRHQLALMLLAGGAVASPQNLTVDDADDSILYSESWGTACPARYIFGFVCANLSQTYNNTLHWAWPSAPDPDTSHNITIPFKGTAVYVYNVLANLPKLSSAPKTNISFLIDGGPVGHYEQPEDKSDGWTYLYNSNVFSHSGLSDEEHTLVIQNVGENSLVIFDYILYTLGDGSPSPGPQTPGPPTPSPSPSLLPAPSSVRPGPPHAPATTSDPGYHPSTGGSSPDTPTLETITTLVSETSTLPPTAPATQRSNRSTGAVAGGIVGAVLASLLLAVPAFFVRKRWLAQRNGKRMLRLMDEDTPARTVDSDYMSKRNQFLRLPDPAHRVSPDVPRSPRLTMSSVAASPTSYNTEPPSRAYLRDGGRLSIVEKAELARREYPAFIPMEFHLEHTDGGEEETQGTWDRKQWRPGDSQ